MSSEGAAIVQRSNGQYYVRCSHVHVVPCISPNFPTREQAEHALKNHVRKNHDHIIHRAGKEAIANTHIVEFGIETHVGIRRRNAAGRASYTRNYSKEK